MCLFCLIFLILLAICVLLARLFTMELWFPFFFPMVQISLIILALFWDEVFNIIVDILIVLVSFKVLTFLW